MKMWLTNRGRPTYIMKKIAERIKILHLEDNSHDAGFIARMLEKAGIHCEIRVVQTRVEYEEALHEFVPEIILSDHNLPSFNSLQALDILRKSGLIIPFVLVTGAVSEEF